MPIAHVTFRDQTLGRINDLLLDEGLNCAKSQNLLSYLAGALLDYRDEGVEFSPSVLLCHSIENFLRSFPGSVRYVVGTVPLAATSGPQILKDCAPLTNKNWFIFIERLNDEEARYGVFSYLRLPTAIPLHEGVTIDSTQLSLLVRKIGSNTIEFRGAKGSILTLIFSTVRDSSLSVGPIESFSQACCADVGDSETEKSFKTYLGRALQDALTSSHGTMLICGRDLNLASIPEMRDAVSVTPVLDFREVFAEYQTARSADSILALQRSEELLQGLLRCDGMVVFDTAGRVTAYRVFYRPVGMAAAAQVIVGGARRRAFEGVKTLVGVHLKSVLFRSQDGQTLFHGAD